MEFSAAVNGSSVPLSPQKQQECSSTAVLPPSPEKGPDGLLEDGLVGPRKGAASK